MSEASKYLEEERRGYSLYVLRHRALPSISDGLKASGRRVLWMARDGHKYKTATLAGATMPIHPHAPPEDAINTATSVYGNNIPLFEGHGSFGTLLDPRSYAASRYTAVKVSKFTEEVVFKDINLIPMMDNYDMSLKEPKHFLPLVPIVLVNPTEGMADGFSCNILPRRLEDIVNQQIRYLKGQPNDVILPYFAPINSCGEIDPLNTRKFSFTGVFSVKGRKIHVSAFPYKLYHEKFIEKLNSLVENSTISDYTDNSSDSIDITIVFPIKASLTDAYIEKTLGLKVYLTENMTMIDFDGEKVLNETPERIIELFTEWRLTWYVNRYEFLLANLRKEIQKYKDILLAIKKNVGKLAKDIKNKEELVEFLVVLGIVNTEYIASLPIYRFIEEERIKVEKQLEDALVLEKEYIDILGDEQKRKDIYISELKAVVKQFCNSK